MIRTVATGPSSRHQKVIYRRGQHDSTDASDGFDIRGSPSVIDTVTTCYTASHPAPLDLLDRERGAGMAACTCLASA